MSISLNYPDFFTLSDLVERLVYATTKESKRIVFLVGAPFSAARNGALGVSDVDGIIAAIRKEFEGDPQAENDFDEKLRTALNPYQAATHFLQGRRGQSRLNAVIVDAVLQANHRQSDVPRDSITELRSLEQDISSWALSDAHSQFALLAKKYPEKFGSVILTTNFDPLIEVGLAKHEVPFFRTVLSRDGDIGQTTGNGCHVVHLHGYWLGSDTLHTPRQLTQERPRLKASLANILRDSIVVVTAYGGWDDIFIRSLIDVVLEDSTCPDILWSFYSDREADIVASNSTKFVDFAPGIDRGRISLYKGVKFEGLFDQLSFRLIGPDTRRNGTFANCAESSDPNCLTEVLVNLKPEDDKKAEREQDNYLPQVSAIFGREREIEILKASAAQVITINGMGGQGKSTLAAYYANNPEVFGVSFDFVDWRDCRELDDMLQGAILNLTMKLSENTIDLSVLKELKFDSLVETFVNQLKGRNGLIIFDNIDQYVDLQTGAPLSAVRAIINEFLRTSSSCKLIFTARPRIILESPQTQEVALEGISPEAVRSIYEAITNVDLADRELDLLMLTTEGHPLWVTLISAQVKAKGATATAIAESIRKGKGDLPDKTLASIWASLTEKQMSLLRTIAELERPIPEDQILEIEADLNFNQFTKALKALKALHLVTVRTAPDSKDLIDVHPLIRGYIRKNFPKSQREKFISKIVGLLDRRLGHFVTIFKGKSFPRVVLELWTHKIDLSINSDDFDSAIDSLLEIHGQLDDVGMGEEFIRLSKRVCESVDWPTYCNKSKKFNKLVVATIKDMVESDNLAEADTYVKLYESSIEGTGAQYINLCDAKCYRYWFEGDFEQAIYWGEKGVRLKATSKVDSEYDADHNLALARRDGGRIQEALIHFLGISSEVEVLSPTPADAQRFGSFYGNIGRCYALMGETDKALICYKKSAELLEIKHDGVLNLGYIRYWVAQALAKKGRIEDAIYFYKAAISRWSGLVPARASSIANEMEQLIETYPDMERVRQVPTWRIENRYMEWLRST